MRTRVRSSAISRFAGVVTTVWLCGMGSAWAGGGGSDLAIQSVLNTICDDVGMTSCPKVPTITQAILQMSGLANAAPDYVRGPEGPLAVQQLAPLCSVSSGTIFNVCSQANAISAVNPLAGSPVAVSDLPSLTPLAFTTGKGQAVPVPLGTKGASSFFYAVATGPNGEPNTLTVIFDYPTLTNSNFTKGQVIANVSLPLQVFNPDGSERLICGATGCPASLTSLATLQISACNSGPGCANGFAANVVGDFSMQGTISTMSAGALGIQLSMSFAPSPNSDRSHFILGVQVPLLVTHGNDPAYFGVVPSGVIPVNQLSGLPTAFTSDVVPPSKIGVAPQAAPACLVSGSCPPATTTFPFCASFSGNGGGPLTSAVATFLSIGTDATTYVSSPLPSTFVQPPLLPLLKCPF
jgi:hypothetical protein